jgi:D-lactate dehydrogenase (cytochrome)
VEREVFTQEQEMSLNTDAALAQIVEIVGPSGLVEGSDADALLVDERGLYRGQAALIVRPASTAECAAVVKICNAASIGVVPQGGNTGYCGGATPFDATNQILLSLSRMNRVREIDAVGFTMTVEAGIVLAKAQALAEEHDLLFPLSMGSEGSCQIGGNLATNAGGLAVVRYGTARDLVLGLEVVLPNGEIVSNLKGLRKDNTGYNLNGLFLGAEGSLGVITAAVLKLSSRPRSRQLAWLAVPDAEAACTVLARARRESYDQVVSAEYVSRASLSLVLEHVPGCRDPLNTASDHYVLLELASAEADSGLRDLMERFLETALEAGEISDGVIADSGPQQDSLWALRESIPEAEKREGGSIKHDISVRVSQIPEFLREAESMLRDLPPHRLSVFGHIGDGNLHFNVLPPGGIGLDGFDGDAAPKISAAIYDLLSRLDGSFSAEHGVGILKRAELKQFTPPVSFALMRSIKKTLDPNGIMNPGKVVD